MSKNDEHKLCIGSPGGGMSFYSKQILLNSIDVDFMEGKRVIVIDLEEEYKKLTETMGGKVINKNSNGKINIYDL